MAVAADKQVVDQKIQEYLQCLRAHQVPVWRAYLFGSYVKNAAHSDSDIDLAVFLDRDEIDGFQDDVALMRYRREIDLRIEPHAFARTDYDSSDPFIREIITTGERLV
ncbi:MAG TPA: nucleotidyltransferase domain-containing protein [Candidatus Hydrogenedentes bacterium]|nr:nucleotidyltransferase domain-containing protein [Candidatus Hydrogenedentota bacterium]